MDGKNIVQDNQNRFILVPKSEERYVKLFKNKLLAIKSNQLTSYMIPEQTIIILLLEILNLN